MGTATYHSTRLEAVVEGRPEILIHNGRIYEDVMRKAQLTRHEMDGALRQAGCATVGEVHMATLED